jgi:hypothetical protein
MVETVTCNLLKEQTDGRFEFFKGVNIIEKNFTKRRKMN